MEALKKNYLKQYNYLIQNGIPFWLNVYPNGEFCFHIKLHDSYIVTSDPFDKTDYYVFKQFINQPKHIREDLLKLFPGNIYYIEEVSYGY